MCAWCLTFTINNSMRYMRPKKVIVRLLALILALLGPTQFLAAMPDPAAGDRMPSMSQSMAMDHCDVMTTESSPCCNSSICIGDCGACTQFLQHIVLISHVPLTTPVQHDVPTIYSERFFHFYPSPHFRPPRAI